MSFFGSVEEREYGILRSKEKTLRTSTSTSVPLTCDGFGYFPAWSFYSYVARPALCLYRHMPLDEQNRPWHVLMQLIFQGSAGTSSKPYELLNHDIETSHLWCNDSRNEIRSLKTPSRLQAYTVNWVFFVWKKSKIHTHRNFVSTFWENLSNWVRYEKARIFMREGKDLYVHRSNPVSST